MIGCAFLTYTVLAIDSSIDVSSLLLNTLENADSVEHSAKFKVIQSESETDALEKLETNEIDALLLDQDIPIMSGIDFLKKVKQIDKHCLIPAILVSEIQSEQVILEGIKAGAYYYLCKPFDKNILLSVIQAAVTDYRLKKDLKKELFSSKRTMCLLDEAKFHFQTINEGLGIINIIAHAFHNPEKIVYALGELVINAIEHGNLKISYAEKKELLYESKLEKEIALRTALPENKDKFATLKYKKFNDHIEIEIKDQGSGFAWEKYMSFDPERIADPNGRGIATAKVNFDLLQYTENGTKVICKVSKKRA